MSRPVCHLIIPDLHAPYHDERAWRLALKVGRFLRPDVIVTLGDFIDNYCVSGHRKNPKRARELSYEVDNARARLRELETLGARKKHFLGGNHEHRLERYLCDRAPELYGMVTIDELLRLKPNGWKYVHYGQTLRLGDTSFTHDLGKCGENAPNKARDTYRTHAVIGHVHGMRLDYKGGLVGAAFGWLGSLEHADYMHGAEAGYRWQHGVGIGYLDGRGRMHLTPVAFLDGKCVVNGTLLSA
jgi:hypothetical protein